MPRPADPDEASPRSWRRGLLALALAWLAACGASAASAETLRGALRRAYAVNPLLNAERANVLATRENIPRARSGYLPRLGATADVGYLYEEDRFRGTGGPITYDSVPRGAGLQLTQPLFDGFRTSNAVRQAEAQVANARSLLSNAEQDTLLSGVAAYMDVLRDAAVVELNRRYVAMLLDDLRLTCERHGFGEVTRTDVSQSEARLAAARTQISQAEAVLKGSAARYRQVIGVAPVDLTAPRPADRLIPGTQAAALDRALADHPAIRAARSRIGAAVAQVAITEGELLPTVSVNGGLSQRYGSQSSLASRYSDSFVGLVTGQISVPLYDGGNVYARTRQATEIAGQRRLEADAIEAGIRAAVATTWAQLEATRAQVTTATAQVRASETALDGVREEARAGQRAVFEILNASADLLFARIALVAALRDRVVATYAVLQAIGRLSINALGPEDERPGERMPTQWPGTEVRLLRPTLGTGDPPCFTPSGGCRVGCAAEAAWALRPSVE